MTTNAFTEIDYLAEGRGRVTEQFKNKPVHSSTVRIYIKFQNKRLWQRNYAHSPTWKLFSSRIQVPRQTKRL